MPIIKSDQNNKQTYTNVALSLFAKEASLETSFAGKAYRAYLLYGINQRQVFGPPILKRHDFMQQPLNKLNIYVLVCAQHVPSSEGMYGDCNISEASAGHPQMGC
jgi:hypothetical protein